MNAQSFLPILMLIFLRQFTVAQTAQPVYQSETLQIEQISPHTFVHVSYLSTQDFGKVACNGMLVIDGGEALVFDTPTDSAVSEELIRWVETAQKAQIKSVLATHFHNDCLGGLGAFHAHGVSSYGYELTLALAKEVGEAVPQQGFADRLILKAGGVEVLTRFMGEGHTRDNVVAYVAADRVLFGGCLIKALSANFGFLGDANTREWSRTVSRVKAGFPETRVVIPGHGRLGGVDLLDYTERLFDGK